MIIVLCNVLCIIYVMLLCLHAGVVMRRDGHELLLDAVADVERLDEVVDGLLCHGLVGAC